MKTDIEFKKEHLDFFEEKYKNLLNENSNQYNPQLYYGKKLLLQVALIIKCHLVVEWLSKILKKNSNFIKKI
jgi:hypothetical protein